MDATTTARNPRIEPQRARWLEPILWFGLLFVALALFMVEPVWATGIGTGGAGAAQTRINAVATGWQNIVQGVGVTVLIIAWSYIGYQIAFSGKSMKDMFPTMVGTSIAGLAPVLVGWMFS